VLDCKVVGVWPVFVVLAAVLGGCSGNSLSEVVTGKSATPAPSGPTQYPDQYKTQIANFMRTYVDNPIKIRDASIGGPVLRPIDGSPPLYVACVRYSPRDVNNQYRGSETRLAVFLNGKLSEFVPEKPEICGGLNYVRYPEIENLGPV
jgi:hypothetical protein